MKDCSQVDPLVTPFVDGEVTGSDRQEVADHLEACGPCRRHAGKEQAARELLHARTPSLLTTAPAGVRIRCQQAATGAPRGARTTRAIGRWALAAAATLVLAVAGALMYGTVVNPSVAVAAQLTFDHIKCFTLFDSSTELTPSEVRAFLRARHGWEIAVPDQADGLALVGGRHCVYLDGSVAHLLYKAGSEPVSVFVLPPGETLHAHDAAVLGYAAVSFERAGRTWVVLARQPAADVERLTRALAGPQS